jgi:glycosyltransferase XagB
MVAMILAPLSYPPLAVITLQSLLDGSLLRPRSGWDMVASAAGLFVLAAGVVGAVAPVVLAMQDRGTTRRLAALALLPFYYVFVSAAAWVALKDLLYRPFQWNKTEHGEALTFTSSGAPRRRLTRFLHRAAFAALLAARDADLPRTVARI